MLQPGRDVRTFVRFAGALHAVGIVGLLIAAAGSSFDLGPVIAMGVAVGGVVYIGAVYMKKRWLRPYIELPKTAIGRWASGNLPAARGFDRALIHAGQLLEREGTTWVKASRIVVYGCFSVWAAVAVISAIRA